MSKKRVMKLASRGKRFGAFCIDIAAPFVILNVLMIASGISAARYRSFMNNPFGPYGYGFGYGYGNGFGFGYDTPRISSGMSTVISVSALLLLAYIVVQLVFFSKSKTMGKAALGLQVVSGIDGKPIGFWMMLLREWIVKRASSYVFMLGYIWILIDEKNKGWHDKILDTYVIDEKESSRISRARSRAAESAEAVETAEVTEASEAGEIAGAAEAMQHDRRKPEDVPTAEAAAEPVNENAAEAAPVPAMQLPIPSEKEVVQLPVTSEDEVVQEPASVETESEQVPVSIENETIQETVSLEDEPIHEPENDSDIELVGMAEYDEYVTADNDERAGAAAGSIVSAIKPVKETAVAAVKSNEPEAADINAGSDMDCVNDTVDEDTAEEYSTESSIGNRVDGDEENL